MNYYGILTCQIWTLSAEDYIPPCVINDDHLGFISLADVDDARAIIRREKEAYSYFRWESLLQWTMAQRGPYWPNDSSRESGDIKFNQVTRYKLTTPCQTALYSSN